MMDRRFRIAATVLILFLAAGPPRTARAGDPGFNVGATEVVSAPAVSHLGVYPYASGSIAFAAGPVAVIPSLGVEVCPEFGRWGFVAIVDVDLPISTRVGLDVLASVVHDQAGQQWHDAALLAGGGVGVSLVFDRVVVSPSVSLFAGVNTPGWSVVPGVNVSHGF